jgi:diguanylate cyclase (GGDEF)-like protein/PAS domain S-box-containing protein
VAEAEIKRILYSPFSSDEVIGFISLIPEARVNYLQARHSTVLSTLSSSLLIGLTALLVLLTVRSSLSRPLIKVSSTLHAITAGEQARLAKLPSHQDDELGQLVDDINGLLDTVEEKFEAEHLLLQKVQALGDQLRDIFENTSAGIFLLDEHGALQTANPTLSRVLAIPEAKINTLLGHDFAEQVFQNPEQFYVLMNKSREGIKTISADLQLRRRDSISEVVWVHCLLSRHVQSDGLACFEGVVYDITERRVLEMRVRHEADHDPLTGLHRRQAVERDLASLLAKPPQGEERHVVLLLDLDNFKNINDTYGHAAGDVVLIEIARRLQACVRADDIVARLGGDEFVIVLVDCVPLERAREIARKLVTAVTQTIVISDDLQDRVGVSIGIAAHDATRNNIASLFEAADQAMYEVKRQGKNGFGIIDVAGNIMVEKLVF